MNSNMQIKPWLNNEWIMKHNTLQEIYSIWCDVFLTSTNDKQKYLKIFNIKWVQHKRQKLLEWINTNMKSISYIEHMKLFVEILTCVNAYWNRHFIILLNSQIQRYVELDEFCIRKNILFEFQILANGITV